MRNSWRTRFGSGGQLNLGDYLDDAREWARDEIDTLKGRLTLRDESWIRHKRAGSYVRGIALGDAAHSLLSGMRANGRAERYVDRLDKLFSNNVSDRLKNTRLDRISAKAMARCLVKRSVPASNIRILRSFISQIFERGAEFYGPLGRLPDELSTEIRERWERAHDVRYPELRKFKKSKYEAIFTALEGERRYWQSALCIRLFFEFKAPLSRVMAAQWAQIVGDRWYPYWPDEKVLWYESEERIDDTTRSLLSRISEYVARDFPGSRYFFPTRQGRSVEHIRSVDTVWRRILRNCGIAHYPLREFARSYRNPNCPSYYLSFLRQYGELFREIGNVAELSKSLMELKKSK